VEVKLTGGGYHRRLATGSILSVESSQPKCGVKNEKCGVQNSIFTSRNQLF